MNYWCTMERVFRVEDKDILYDSCEPDRFDWQHPCAYMYRADFLKTKHIRYPVGVKIYEDVTFVDIALFHAHSHKKVNRIIFTYWEAPTSCLHTVSILEHLKAQEAVNEMKQEYYKAFGVDFDKDERMALFVAECLPRLCTALNRASTRECVETNCNRYLRDHPDKRLWRKCQEQLERYNRHPTCFWLRSRMTIGALLGMKRVMYSIPYVDYLANCIISRVVLKMHPIKQR